MDQTILSNLNALGSDDLIDAYDKLAVCYKSLKSTNDKLQQSGMNFSDNFEKLNLKFCLFLSLRKIQKSSIGIGK